MFWGKESTKFLDSTSIHKGEKSIWSKNPFDASFPVSVPEIEFPEVPEVGTEVMTTQHVHRLLEAMSAEIPASDMKTHLPSRSLWVTLESGDHWSQLPSIR